MQIIKLITTVSIATLVTLSIASSVQASDPIEEKHEVIVIKKQSDDGSITNMEFDSDKNGAFLHDLADGESKTINTSSGESVTVSRVGDELNIQVDGENIAVPMPSDASGHQVRVMKFGDDGHENIDMEMDMDVHMPKGLTISSSRELDTATQETIKAAIANAGIQDEVHFSKGHKSISKMMFISDDGEVTKLNDIANIDLDLEGADIQEFTTKDGKHVKIIKKHIKVDE